MKRNPLEKRYDCLTPEERFRLILAASGRGDETERHRLVRAGKSITLSTADHAPWAHAFDELAMETFIELQEDVARYLDALARARDAGDWSSDADDQADEDDGEVDGDATIKEADGKADAKSAQDDDGQRPAWQQALDLALAAGYVLRTHVEGWKLFCARLNVPPFLVVEGFTGFDRLERALGLAEKAAFGHEGMLRWLNAIRPAADPPVTKIALTAAAVAASTEEELRHRVGWWRG